MTDLTAKVTAQLVILISYIAGVRGPHIKTLIKKLSRGIPLQVNGKYF